MTITRLPSTLAKSARRHPTSVPTQGDAVMRTAVLGLAAVLAAAPALFAADKDTGDKKVPAVLNFKMKTLDGKDTDLSQYQGKVILLVNVASKCGYTHQYGPMEALYKK